MPRLIFDVVRRYSSAVQVTDLDLAITHSASGVGVKGWVLTSSELTAKHYVEFYLNEATQSGTSTVSVGVTDYDAPLQGNGTNNGVAIAQGGSAILIYVDGVNTGSYTGVIATGDTLMMAADRAANLVWFGRNGTWLNGDPGAGTGGLACNLDRKFFGAGVLITNVTPVRKITGRFTTASQLYAAPTGFTTYEGALTNLGAGYGDSALFEGLNQYGLVLRPSRVTSGSVVSLVNNLGGRVAIDTSRVYVNDPTLFDFETNASHDLILRETLNGETVDTRLPIQVYDNIETGSIGVGGIELYPGPSGAGYTSYAYPGNTISFVRTFTPGWHILTFTSTGNNTTVAPIVKVDGVALTILGDAWGSTTVYNGFAVYAFTATGEHTITLERATPTKSFGFKTTRVVGSTEILGNLVVTAVDYGGNTTKSATLQYPPFGGITFGVGTFNRKSVPWTLSPDLFGPYGSLDAPANTWAEDTFLTTLAKTSAGQIKLTSGGGGLGGFQFITFTLAPAVVPSGGNILFDYNQKYTHVQLADSGRGLAVPGVNVGSDSWCFTNKQLAAGEKIYVEFHPVLQNIGALGVGGRADTQSTLSDGLSFMNNRFIFANGVAINPSGEPTTFGNAKVGMALDVDAGLTYFHANGVWINFTGAPGVGPGASYATLGKWIGAALFISNGGPSRELTSAFTFNRLSYPLPAGYTAADGTTAASATTRKLPRNSTWL